MYTYNATVVRVIDGDTAIVDVDLGFYMTARMSCRLAGLNARELHDDGGREARDYLCGLLPVEATVQVDSVKADKYAGRFDGVVTRRLDDGSGINVNQRLIDMGYAAKWDGSGPRPVPPWPLGVTVSPR
jgi:endonuclease YncB( thermonuclease family)